MQFIPRVVSVWIATMPRVEQTAPRAQNEPIAATNFAMQGQAQADLRLGLARLLPSTIAERQPEIWACPLFTRRAQFISGTKLRIWCSCTPAPGSEKSSAGRRGPQRRTTRRRTGRSAAAGRALDPNGERNGECLFLCFDRTPACCVRGWMLNDLSPTRLLSAG